MEKKDNFIKRYNYVKDDIIKRLGEALIRAIGNEYLVCSYFGQTTQQTITNY